MSSLCKECQDCCCKHENGGTFITLHEALRIARALDLPIDEVCEFIEDKDLKDDKDFINYHNLYVNDKGNILPLCYKRHILIIKKNGRYCIFLGKDGCTMPRLRPAYCHIFPFWFKITKEEIIIFPMSSSVEETETCLIRKKHFLDENYTKMLEEIGETKASLLNIILRFLEEIRAYQGYAKLLFEGFSPSEVVKMTKISLEKSL